MNVRERVFSNYKLRVLFRGGDVVNNYTSKNGAFTPFFAYTIGTYKDDYKLYFSKEPGARAYYNEIFNKMSCYYASDAIEFIKFHLDLYHDKPAFLNFLFYELQHRGNQLNQLSFFNKRGDTRRRSIYEMALLWVKKEMEELQMQNK